MKYIDDLGLPALARAVERHGYDNKNSLSVTTLIRPPWMVQLEKKHWNEIEVLVSDQLFMLFGQAAHAALERTQVDGDFVETRVSMEIAGTKVSGQFDRLTKDGVLVDWKFTSIYTLKKAVKGIINEDYIAQMNMLAALIRELNAGRAQLEGEFHAMPEPRALKLLLVARDWRVGEAESQKDYPPEAMVVNIPLWPHEKVMTRFFDRVSAHTSGSPPLCSLEDRWAVPDKWAVMGKTKALRLLDSEEDAKKWAEAEGIEKPRIEFRQGNQWKRCRGKGKKQYCPVAKFCIPFLESVRS